MLFIAAFERDVLQSRVEDVFRACRSLSLRYACSVSLPADYPRRTPLCRHATGEPIELASQAVKLGLKEIGFSEHNPMIRDDWDEWHMLQRDFDTYIENVQKARRAF